MVLMINLETGETLEADEYALKERGRPEGYREADYVSVKEWIEALQAAIQHGHR